MDLDEFVKKVNENIRSKNKLYRVKATYYLTAWIYVEASSIEEARDKFEKGNEVNTNIFNTEDKESLKDVKTTLDKVHFETIEKYNE